MEIQWTNDIIILLVVACSTALILSYLITALIQGRKITQLSAEHSQSEKQISELQQSIEKTALELDNAQQANHQHDILQSKQEQQISNYRNNETRLAQEINELKTLLNEANDKQQLLVEQLRAIEKQLEAANADNRSSKEQITEVKARLTQSESDKQSSEQAFNTLNQTHTELKTTLEKREEHFKQQMQQLSDTKQSLTKEFENLAGKIFEEKGKTFTQTSQTSIDSMLKPFREQIEGFQKRVNDVHDESIKGNTSLNSEIKKVLDIGLKMSSEANNLTSALKGDSQQRGAWGEAQLHRTLEMSGLVEDAHFEVQSAFKDADGKNKYTDYLIKLPDGKHIIIDSKVSLIAYDRAVGAETPEEHNLAMIEHIKSVRKHIDDLSSKDYTNLIGMHSPSFVLMFMPIEPAYIEALKNNKDLFEYGYKKGIVLVSHTTLIPILRTVSNLWMIERSNHEAREISEKAGEIYNSVCTVAERLNKLGGTLNTASNHYNSTVKALAGQQGLYGKVDRFTQLSAKVNKSLPSIEPSHVDFEQERLSLVVEAIEEEPTLSEAPLEESENLEATIEKKDV